ncbi:2-oxoglutarate-Fe(II) type oxidoreductase ppzD-like [Amphibalanus amphitrite]|uniref:2-oxoglutarate-Fe(II) type oxidoreductase ppzD-like n=1 Tax=Amphibalanus amphitrite TaxID=1232801 RepID=UPI001C91E0A1|nr:2-oxoglutarate-Fe(II) type oxidoreductase ppzD-like [Amphibalanus amphitrite]XP_043245985.1 2-oxoglutarate-Fe(II) type oxidoreductase ppzD-like [Amphibalanus amphitrite]
MESIPSVDMQPDDLKGLSDEQRLEQVGKRILDALKDIGFVYLLNHGLPEELRNSAFKSASDFFALPIETKLKYHRFQKTRVNGYTPIKDEVLSNSDGSRDSDTLSELKEAWDMMVPGEDMPTAEAPVFCRDFEALMSALSALSLRVLAGLEVALGRPALLTASHRHQLGAESGTVLRAVHYPPLPEPVPAGAVRCATHSDWGSIILLLQDPCGGLEVLSRAGRWVPAPHVPGAVLLNAGDLLEIWTGGQVLATKHRVAVPEEERLRRADRLSLVYFGQPDDDAMVVPPSGAEPYHAVNAREYLAAKYRSCLLKYKE